MKAKLIQIGNSRGIRIPKTLLSQTGIVEEINMEVEENRIIIEPVKQNFRSNWNVLFKEMAEKNEDELFDEESLVNQTSFDETEWDW